VYRAIHALSYRPAEDILTALKNLAQGKGQESAAASAALKAISPQNRRNPAILIPVDASQRSPRDRLYPMNFEVPLEELDLLMIEQPLGYDDIFDHSRLQPQLKTPICLDESIHTPGDAQLALHLNACRIINIKVGRVGGFTSALAIHNICAEAGAPVWCGGMLETGIGRAANLHLASLPNFTLPGDISATERYFHQDIAEPTFSLNAEDSTISVPQGPGLGVEVQMDRVEKFRLRQETVKKANGKR
jgi:O-succinylbenzoate synthase